MPYGVISPNGAMGSCKFFCPYQVILIFQTLFVTASKTDEVVPFSQLNEGLISSLTKKLKRANDEYEKDFEQYKKQKTRVDEYCEGFKLFEKRVRTEA